MYTELFAELGLSPNEAKIYEALITYGGSGVSTVALRSGVHRRNAYDSLHRLIEKGLVSEVFSQGETVYEAVDPEKLMEIVREKEMRLNKALPDLLKSFRTHKVPQRAYIYKGLEGFKNYLRDVLRTGEDVHLIGAKGFWFDPRLETFTEWFLKEAKRKGIRYHHIFDHDVEHQLPHVLKAVGKPYKFLPKKYDTESAIDIFGDHVVTFTGLGLGKLEDDVTVFVMVDPQLADSYRTWWKMLWDILPDPGTTKRGTKGQRRLSKRK